MRKTIFLIFYKNKIIKEIKLIEFLISWIIIIIICHFTINLNNTDAIKQNITDKNENSIKGSINYFEFQMYSPNDIISNKNENNPINFRKNYFNYELVSPGTVNRNEINTKYVEYLSDKGYIFKRHENSNGFSIESIQTKTRDIGSVDFWKNNLYYVFRLYFNSDNIQSYQRTYKKLPAVLADISGIVSLLITVGQFMIGFLYKYYLETETISKIFKSKIFFNSKNKLKKRNNINLKNTLNYKKPIKKINNDLLNNSNQKNEIISIRDDNKINNKNININNDKNNELSLINNNLSKNILIIKNSSSEKQNIKIAITKK